MSTEFLEFHSACGIASVFSGSVSRYTRGTLVGITATLGTFEGNNDAYAFLACHDFCGYLDIIYTFTYINTQLTIFAYDAEFDQIFF